jgi:ABC-2 type transport system ATP-binding protein
LLYDGDLAGLVARFSPHKTIVVDLDEGAPVGDGHVTGLVGNPDWLLSQTPDRITLRVPRSETARVTARLLSDLPVLDVSVEEPPIDEVIDLVFAAGPDAAVKETET